MERYRLLRRIARGGSAEIFEAIDREDGQRVAIKRLLDTAHLPAFRDEARLMGRLLHPNIVALLDFGIIAGRWSQVLELAASDLEHLAADPLPEELALYVVREVARALDHAHRAVGPGGRPLGIVHRDVTPENILITASGRVKLADFGVAFAASREARTATGVVKGKLPYMAAEQLVGGPIDPRTDVFALGCVLHRLLTGESPIASARARNELAAGRDPTLAELPAHLEAIIARAVAASPEDRYASAGEMALACHARSPDPEEALAAMIAVLDPSEVRPHPARDLLDLDLVPDPVELAPTVALRRPLSRAPLAAFFLTTMLSAGAAALASNPAEAPPPPLLPTARPAPLAIARPVAAPLAAPIAAPSNEAPKRPPAPKRRRIEPTRAPVLPCSVPEHLGEISRRLRTEQSRLASRRFESLELRYFELRSALHPGASRERCLELAGAVRAFQREIEGALIE